jgi:lysyl-tRNA synthetase class II
MSSIHHWNKNMYKPWISDSLNKEFLMEKSPEELEKIGRKHGIELDKRKKKESLVDELYDVL